MSFENGSVLSTGRRVSRGPQDEATTLLPSLVAGLLVGLLVISFSASFGVLIFGTALGGAVQKGIAMVLFGSTVMCLVVALGSRYRGMVALSQDIPAAISALIASSLAGALPVESTDDERFQTVIAALALATVLTGLVLFVIGRFRLGNLVRFLPYPVIGGFTAGIGWLMTTGGLGIMLGRPFSIARAEDLVGDGALETWLPGLGFAVIALLVARNSARWFALPALIVGSIGLFYVVTRAIGVSSVEASSRGLLLPSLGGASGWSPLLPSDLVHVHWSSVAAEAGNILSIVVLSVVCLVLYLSAVETATGRELDVNYEFKVAGVANALAGVGSGSPVGFHSPSCSMLGYRMGANSRAVGATAALVCGSTLAFGSSLIQRLPKLVLGGLVVYLGLAFLVEWLVDAWSRLSRKDYCLVLVILVAVGALGFLEGVVIGVLIAMLLFVVDYSRVDVVRESFSGAQRQSWVERPAAQQRILRERGDSIWVIRLQGFLFFGTANDLLVQARERLRADSGPALRFVVVDFTLVTGLDSSALVAFERLRQAACDGAAQLVLTKPPALIERFLDDLRTCPNLEAGLEWSEEQLLAETDGAHSAANLEGQLRAVLPAWTTVGAFIDWLQREELPAGTTLMRQGEQAEDLYFIESGEMVAVIDHEDGQRVHVRKLRGGTMVGEIGLSVGGTRSASVVATEDSVVYRLSLATLDQLRREAPAVAADYQQFLIHLLATRLGDTTRRLG